MQIMHDPILQMISYVLLGLIRVSGGLHVDNALIVTPFLARSFRKSVLHHGEETGFAHAK
jgi:hypothetical protein